MIQVRDLHKTLGTEKVLRGVDLRIETGETCVIMGRSGCGKSVLLKHFIGLLRPTSGEVRVEGHDIARLPEKKLRDVRSASGSP